MELGLASLILAVKDLSPMHEISGSFKPVSISGPRDGSCEAGDSGFELPPPAKLQPASSSNFVECSDAAAVVLQSLAAAASISAF